MMALLAQMLVVVTQVPAEPDPKKITAAPPEYRRRCSECDEVGRDARFPCEGHD